MEKGEADDPSAATDGRRASVLVVDDEPELRRLLRRRLARTGHQVVEAANGRAALELVRRQAFDLVISDVRMPELDGLSLLEVLRRHHPEVAVVLVSGNPDLDRASAAYGALDYLLKPVAFEDLQRVVNLALDGGRHGSESAQLRHSETRLKVPSSLERSLARVAGFRDPKER